MVAHILSMDHDIDDNGDDDDDAIHDDDYDDDDDDDDDVVEKQESRLVAHILSRERASLDTPGTRATSQEVWEPPFLETVMFPFWGYFGTFS